MIRLGVNVDHIATLRQARGTPYPSPVHAALIAEQAGASNITCHLREDRRHIQDEDVRQIKANIKIPLNFEMAATAEMVEIAQEIQPHWVTLVPEGRQELTTERGLDRQDENYLKSHVRRLLDSNISVCLFAAPSIDAIHVAENLGVGAVEIHTGPFCSAIEEAATTAQKLSLVRELAKVAQVSADRQLQVHVGHGLNYQNAFWLQLIPEVEEANIGHAIVSESTVCGFEQAVRGMMRLLNDNRHKPATGSIKTI